MLAISPIQFRVLVIVSAVLPFVGLLLNALFLPQLPVPRSTLLPLMGQSMFDFLAGANLVTGIVATIGLCLFRPWSRSLSLLSIAVSVLLYAMAAYFVDSGPKVAIDWLATLLGGAVLALAYCSPIALRFAPAPVASPAL
ncbi:hypothetical protein ACSUZJ_02745 [Telluria sp. B2]